MAREETESMRRGGKKLEGEGLVRRGQSSKKQREGGEGKKRSVSSGMKITRTR